jgi:hypothetical protein
VALPLVGFPAMWTEPSSAMVAGIQSLVLAAGSLGLGYLVADAFTARLRLPDEMRWALALPGLMAFALVMMGVHIATGGRLFSSPALVRTVTLVTAIGLLALRLARRGRTTDRVVLLSALGCLMVALVVWAPPVFQALPLNFEPDTDLHMGWASQLLNGAPVPTSPITGPIPNFYPWLYHALVATIAPFAPSGRAFETLGALQIVQTAGAVLGLFAVGRALTGKTFTGIASAAFGGVLGGLGLFAIGDLGGLREALRTDGEVPAVLGDVFGRRPYSFAFNNLAPPLPRDLTFALLAIAAGLLAVAVTRRAVAPLVTAGVVLGLIGLTGGEAFFVGTVASLVVILIRPPTAGRITSLGWFLVPAILIYSLWAGPLLVNYLDLGGFVNTTRVAAIARGPLEILAAWSVAVPFALVGAVVWVPKLRARDAALIPFSFAAVPVLYLLVSGFIPRLFGDAFLTLGRDHRYWPLAGFGVALYAARGATWVWERIRMRWVSIALAVVVIGLGLGSPLVSASMYEDKFPEQPLVASALRGDPDALLNVLVREMKGRCRAAVPLKLAKPVFAYTGFRLVLWVALPDRDNWGRTRFADLAESEEEGFERLADVQAVVLARPEPARWKHLVESYDLDAVVAPERKAGSAAFAGLQETAAEGDGEGFVVLTLDDCG